MKKILAGIVLFNADYERLLKCIAALEKQVDSIVIWDNSPQKYSNDTIEELSSYKNCRYIYSGKNIGMPDGMNKIMEMALDEGYDWVLTMNSDSIVPNNLMEEFFPFMSEKEVGMVCPQIIDKRRKYMKVEEGKDFDYVNMCITSAACTNLKAWEQVGKFDSWLFVDLLDNDISKRMILNGWKIVRVNSVVLDQEFGEIKAKSENVEKIWLKIGQILHNDNFAKLSYKKIVHPIRVYYTCRNIIYLNKKFKNYGGIGYKENYNCNSFIGFLICFVLPSILRSNKKVSTIKAVVKGFKDGKIKEVDTWTAEPIS